MLDRYARNLGQDPLSWINLGFSRKIELTEINRQRKTARAILQRLFGADPVPGVILGDEVGMGKTYEALAVIAAVFRHKPRARVIVLTHSGQMARIWRDRWKRFRLEAIPKMYSPKMPAGEFLENPDDIGIDQLSFGSYETVKNISPERMKAALYQTFKGRYLRRTTIRRLASDLLGTWARPETEDGFRIPRGALDRFWEAHFDEEPKGWKSVWAAQRDLRRLVYRASRTRRRVDLLVVDEAHKTASDRRQLFLLNTLGNRARRVLYVTATPFALSVCDLFERIEDMHEVTGKLRDSLGGLRRDLGDFRDAVRRRQPLPRGLKDRLEGRLRRYLVRSLWPDEIVAGIPRRRVIPLSQASSKAARSALVSLEDEAQAIVTLALERTFLRIVGAAGATHRASYRETLCSSYAAIRQAVREAGRRRTSASGFFAQLDPLLPKREPVKFRAVAELLCEFALRREKVVVFCRRVATILALRKELRSRLAAELTEERKRWDRVRDRLLRARRMGRQIVTGEELHKLRLAAHLFEKVRPRGEKRTLRRLDHLLKRSGEPGQESAGSRDPLWEAAWGPRRRVDWVGAMMGGSGDDGESSRDAVQFAFNLPGPPYVLLCSQIAREGIDLHLWCRRIVHYDLEWNPAMMEQQVGRIDRIGSLSRRVKRPIEVYYAWQPGTYEERIARTVRDRQEMMAVLLGAGEWLATATPEDQESIPLIEYSLDFRPWISGSNGRKP